MIRGWLRRALLAGALATASLAWTQETDKTIVDLQPARTASTQSLPGEPGGRGAIVLTNLNPAINAWFLLEVRPWGAKASAYHLENPDPAAQRISLDPDAAGRLSISSAAGTQSCVLWPGHALAQARASALPFAPLCDGRLYLRNAVPGNRTNLEATTEFLRDHVWRGEQIIGFVKRKFYGDAFAQHATPLPGEPTASAALALSDVPVSPSLASAHAARIALPADLGIDIGVRDALMLGQWYPVAGLDAVFVSVIQPEALAANIPRGPLDGVESAALDYLVAFDLSAFDVGFSLGTEHPRLGWSERVPESRRDVGLPGPDGIDRATPLVRTGMVSPALEARTVAAFTGGFKREHGAFTHGTLAQVNRGSHYGFIEQGVVFSTLQPGLSTLYVLDDGSVDMKTWSRADDRLLGRIRHARQNGVPLIERSATGGPSVAGSLVDQWGPGNWSGSAEEKLRSLRAGACLVEQAGRRFLVYGYFSTATPRAMARVFGAYGCRYAMHLDMNALEHTYLALYPHGDSRITVEHVVRGMSVLDKEVHGALVPRFLGFPDDRDFFYLVSRKVRR